MMGSIDVHQRRGLEARGRVFMHARTHTLTHTRNTVYNATQAARPAGRSRRRAGHGLHRPVSKPFWLSYPYLASRMQTMLRLHDPQLITPTPTQPTQLQLGLPPAALRGRFLPRGAGGHGGNARADPLAPAAPHGGRRHLPHRVLPGPGRLPRRARRAAGLGRRPGACGLLEC